MKNNKYASLGFIIASCVGLLNSFWLVWMHLNKSAQEGCSINSVINCSAINHPTYSQWFSIPVSFFSLITFAIILVMFNLWKRASLSEKSRQSIESFITLLVWLCLAAMVYFAAVTVLVIKSFCLYCTVFYASSIAMFIFWRKLSASKNLSENFSNVLSSKYFAFSCVAGFIALVLGKTVLFPNKASVSENVQTIALSSDLSNRTLGQENAPITIVKYSDFQCPACKNAGSILKSLARESQGKVKLVYKYFPLDSKCNPSSGSMHPYACQAAIASLCAGQQNQFWSYHDLIFANQMSLSDSSFTSFANQLSLDIGSFKQCLQSSAAFDRVSQDIQEGKSVKLKHTPTIFINGREYKGRITRSGLMAVINSL